MLRAGNDLRGQVGHSGASGAGYRVRHALRSRGAIVALVAHSGASYVLVRACERVRRTVASAT